MNILLDRNIKIYRLSQISGNNTGYITATTTMQSTIQPLGAEKTAMSGGSYGKMFVVYVDVDKNILEGDQIRDENGNIYEVIAGGIDNRTDGFMADYMGITCKKIS